MRRCHFIAEPIGSIHATDWEAPLRPRRCPNAVCGCHIGYVNLGYLNQAEIYGAGLLERIPQRWPLDQVSVRDMTLAGGSHEGG
jgi:hypothetical protein